MKLVGNPYSMTQADEFKTLLSQLQQAAAVALPHNQALRLFHGRGRKLPEYRHVNIDWFAPVVFITLYQALEQAELEQIVDVINAAREDTCVVVQHRYLAEAPKECVQGVIPEQVYACEGAMRFHLELSKNQNLGFFLDMKPGRDWLADVAQGKRVLNLFAYTCALSVAALAHDADEVVNVDMAKGPLQIGQQNHDLNQRLFKPESKVRFWPYDILRSWRKLEDAGPFDIVLLDPPSKQGKSFSAQRDYAKVIRHLPRMLADNAYVLACLNAPYLGSDFINQCFAELETADSEGRFRFERRLANREDMPEVDQEANLKLMVFEFSRD